MSEPTIEQMRQIARESILREVEAVGVVVLRTDHYEDIFGANIDESDLIIQPLVERVITAKGLTHDVMVLVRNPAHSRDR